MDPVKDWTVELQVRRHCFLASPVLTDPTAFLSHFGYCALGEEEASFYITMLYVNPFLVCNGSLRHLHKTWACCFDFLLFDASCPVGLMIPAPEQRKENRGGTLKQPQVRH